MTIPLSGPHGASLATTAGITAVITGVLAASILAQAPATAGPGGQLAAASGTCLAAAAGWLYAARNAVGSALDHAGDPEAAAGWSARALKAYHAGMAALFLGLACAAAWRLGLTQGWPGWLATGVAIAAAMRAAARALQPRQGP